MAKPKEITFCIDTHIETASFEFRDGINYAKEKGLKQSSEFSDVRKGTHFIVCCGDVMIKVESDDFLDIPRRHF